MYTIPLLPNSFKKPGFIIIAFGLAAWLLTGLDGNNYPWLNIRVLSLFNKTNDPDTHFASIIQNNVLDELISMALIAGAVFVGFSKEKNENEFTMAIRCSSMFWAVLVYYTVQFISIGLLYDYAFFKLVFYNLFTILFIYITRFYYLVYKSTKAMHNGK